MKVSKLSDHKNRKEGIISPSVIVDHLAAAVEREEVEEIVIFTVNKEGIIQAGWSNMNTLRALGLIEAGKAIVMEALED
jgi:hypothetical protein